MEGWCRVVSRLHETKSCHHELYQSHFPAKVNCRPSASNLVCQQCWSIPKPSWKLWQYTGSGIIYKKLHSYQFCRCSSCSCGLWKLFGNFYPAEQHSLCMILFLDPTQYIYCLAVLMNDFIWTDETTRASVIWSEILWPW